MNQVTISPHPTYLYILGMTDPGPSSGKGRIAYLGPEGTYGQQVRRTLPSRHGEIRQETDE